MSRLPAGDRRIGILDGVDPSAVAVEGGMEGGESGEGGPSGTPPSSPGG
jgi:hypothetical protein